MKHIDRASQPPGNSTRLHPIDFEVLRDLIHENAGIYFPENKRHVLQSRIMNRLDALSFLYFEDYVEYVCDPTNFGEVLRMLDAVTSTETAFFHSKDQFDSIKNHVIPTLIKQKQQAKSDLVRIWCTACASGEEAYTIALLVREFFQSEHPGFKFEIVGSDINTDALQAAEQGLYKEKSIAAISPALLDKYFTKSTLGYQLAASVMDMVTFKRINLADRTDMMRMHAVDFTLSANVFHSFSSEMKQKTMQAIYNSLSDQGYFMTGVSETLYGLSHPFLEINIAGIQVYQKFA